MSTGWWIVRIMIVIISQALGVIGWGRMIEKKTALVKIIAYNGDITLGCVY
jgi:hypothetical protein